MGVFETVHRRIEDFRVMPGVRHLRRAAYERRFASARAGHMFRGIYASFDGAQRDAPATAPLGYDNPQSTGLYIGRVEVQAHDYPAFFWLAQSLHDGMRSIADLGGNVGIKFRALQSLKPLPAGARWLVIDVPQVVRRGQALCRPDDPGTAALRFSDRFADASGCELLYASGTLQYLPQSLGEMIGQLDRPPRRIVVNTTPIHETLSFFTLNSIGSAYCPYRVQARGSFLAEMAAAGYTLRDSWLNPGKGMQIPFSEGHDIRDYSGFCFDRV